MLAYSIAIATVLLITYLLMSRRRSSPIKGYKTVPEVSWKFPVVGHGIDFSRDIIKFVRKAYKECGPIFRIKVFNKDMIIVCNNDKKLKNEFFRAKEKDMSLYQVLDSLYFADAFSDDPKNLDRIINFVKNTVQVRFDIFMPKIMDEAKRMLERMKDSFDGKTVKLDQEMIRFVSRTSARCFIDVDISDEFFDTLMKFTEKLNSIVVMTYFVPKPILRMIMNPFLTPYRKKMTQLLSPEIQKYRDDPNKNDSMIFRSAVDYRDDDGRTMTNEDIGDIVVCLLYVSSENTALGLTSTLLDLSKHPKWWNRVKEESTKFIQDGDYQSLLKSEILENCLLESARLNTHIFALNRKPQSLGATLGEWYIGDTDCVAFCEPMQMVHDCGEEIFERPNDYEPERYEINKTLKRSHNVMTWGSGVHLCPGKMFAVYEIKAAMALITTNFERFAPPKDTETNYFSPSAFAENHATVKLNLLPQDQQVQLVPNNVFNVKDPNGKQMKVKCYQTEGGCGWLLREVLNNKEQEEFYNYTLDLSKDSEERREIINKPDTNSYPITYYNLVYTGTSNCEPPTKWFEFAKGIWDTLKENSDTLNFPLEEAKNIDDFNSVYSHLYHENSTMNTHKDEHVDWGISVSIGASCEFQFGEHQLILNSGDVFVADFSKVDHAVNKILGSTVPGWYVDDNVETFGRVRCSVQIRDVSRVSDVNKVSIDEFKNFIYQ